MKTTITSVPNSDIPIDGGATFGQCVFAALRERGGRVSVVAGGEQVSGDDLSERAAGLAAAIIARGSRPGTRSVSSWIGLSIA